MGVCRLATACLGLLVAIAVCCCDKPAKSPRQLPPLRNVQDCVNRYGQDGDNFAACAAMVSLQVCVDRYLQSKIVQTLVPFLGGGDNFDACVAKAQD